MNTLQKLINLKKLTNATEDHNGLQYTDGLIVDTKEFIADVECDNGIHFSHMPCYWAHLYGCEDLNTECYLRDVEVPNDATVCIGDDNKVKTNKVNN